MKKQEGFRSFRCLRPCLLPSPIPAPPLDHKAHLRGTANVQPATKPGSDGFYPQAQSLHLNQAPSPLKGSSSRKKAREGCEPELLCTSGSQLTAEKSSFPAKGAGRGREGTLCCSCCRWAWELQAPHGGPRPDFRCSENLIAMKHTARLGYFSKLRTETAPVFPRAYL